MQRKMGKTHTRARGTCMKFVIGSEAGESAIITYTLSHQKILKPLNKFTV